MGQHALNTPFARVVVAAQSLLAPRVGWMACANTARRHGGRRQLPRQRRYLKAGSGDATARRIALRRRSLPGFKPARPRACRQKCRGRDQCLPAGPGLSGVWPDPPGLSGAAKGAAAEDGPGLSGVRADCPASSGASRECHGLTGGLPDTPGLSGSETGSPISIRRVSDDLTVTSPDVVEQPAASGPPGQPQ